MLLILINGKNLINFGFYQSSGISVLIRRGLDRIETEITGILFSYYYSRDKL